MSTDDFYQLFTETGDPMYWLMSREAQIMFVNCDTTEDVNEADR